MCLINNDDYEYNNPNRNFHNNDLSYTWSKKHNNIYIVNFCLGVYVYNVDKEENVGTILVNKRLIIYMVIFVK